MSGKGISLDKVELLSVPLEGTLYGFSLMMFGGTIWVLLSHRSICHVNYKIIAVACLLLLFSTAHFVINIIRLLEAFILDRDTYPGGSIAYFVNVSRWTFVYRFYVFTAQTLLGAAVVLYRCYVVWQSKLVMILPALLWCAVGVFGIGSPYMASQLQHQSSDEEYDGSKRLLLWTTLFWASALATNVVATLLFTYRIWYVDRKAKRIHGPGKSQLRPILSIIIDAGVIYSLTLLGGLICLLYQANFPYGMIAPIISITFYMVVIRVGAANRVKQTMSLPLESTFMDMNMNDTDSRLEMQVHIRTMTERKIENGRPSSIIPIDRDNHRHGDNPDCVEGWYEP